MFPAFATALVQDQARAARLFERAVNYIFLSLFPVVLIIVTLAHEGLSLWLGREFADNSTLVMQLLAVGVFINSCAHVPFGMVQSAGRPDLTAKLHLIELPFYLLILWWLLGTLGIVGAAIAWVVRVAVDTLFLFAMAQRLLQSVSPLSLRLVFMAAYGFIYDGSGCCYNGTRHKRAVPATGVAHFRCSCLVYYPRHRREEYDTQPLEDNTYFQLGRVNTI